jgi:hypothetical protein
MEDERKPGDPTVEKLALDMKAVGLLYPSDADLRTVLASEVLDPRDQQVMRVVSSLGAGKPKRGLATIIVALGELILTSFLMVGGVASIAGLFLGGTNPDMIIRYFGTAIGSDLASGPLYQLLPVLEVLLSVLLLVSSLYLLRRASLTLKEAGFGLSE